MNPSPRTSCDITFAGQKWVLDASGALYWPAKKMLIVSDLHLEKGSFLAQFGSVLPQYDSRDTLAKLEKVIAAYSPETVLCLGDSFHDRKAFARLSEEDNAQLLRLVGSCANWQWILGNHDSSLPDALPGTSSLTLQMEGICFTHEPISDEKTQVFGHFHPKIRLKMSGNRVSGKCFLVAHDMLVMPSFGAYTGGLDCEDAVVTALSKNPFKRYLLYREKVWKL